MTERRKMIDMSRRRSASEISGSSRTTRCAFAFRKALSQENRLAMAGAGGRGAVSYAQRIDPVLAQADAADAALEAAFAELGGQRRQANAAPRSRRSGEARDTGAHPRGLDSEGRLVVGQVAMRNFQLVRDRLRNIVLRADVGVTEQAWELREEQLTRVRNIQFERSRSEQQLNEELREVLDDMGETASRSGTQPESAESDAKRIAWGRDASLGWTSLCANAREWGRAFAARRGAPSESRKRRRREARQSGAAAPLAGAAPAPTRIRCSPCAARARRNRTGAPAAAGGPSTPPRPRLHLRRPNR